MTDKQKPLSPVTLRRWRMVLGRYAHNSLGQPNLSPEETRADLALDYLYGRELDRRGLHQEKGTGRGGSLDPSRLSALSWLSEVRDLFPSSVCETIQGHALDRYGMSQLLKDPSFVESLTPSTDLLKAMMSFKGRVGSAMQDTIRQLARRVIDDIMRRLKPRVETALSGTRNRFAHSPVKTSVILTGNAPFARTSKITIPNVKCWSPIACVSLHALAVNSPGLSCCVSISPAQWFPRSFTLL
jgi:hypothetical protein